MAYRWRLLDPDAQSIIRDPKSAGRSWPTRQGEGRSGPMSDYPPAITMHEISRACKTGVKTLMLRSSGDHHSPTTPSPNPAARICSRPWCRAPPISVEQGKNPIPRTATLEFQKQLQPGLPDFTRAQKRTARVDLARANESGIAGSRLRANAGSKAPQVAAKRGGLHATVSAWGVWYRENQNILLVDAAPPPPPLQPHRRSPWISQNP